MTTTSVTAVDHGITIITAARAGQPLLQASCLCGWQSEPKAARQEAVAAGSLHAVEGVQTLHPLEMARQAGYDAGYEDGVSIHALRSAPLANIIVELSWRISPNELVRVKPTWMGPEQWRQHHGDGGVVHRQRGDPMSEMSEMTDPVVHEMNVEAVPGVSSNRWHAVCLCGYGSREFTTPTATAAVQSTVTATPGVTVTATPTINRIVATRTRTRTETYTPPPPPTFSEGTYQAGADIKAGRYHTAGGSDCYYEVTNGTGDDDIVDNGDSAGPQYFRISGDQYVQLSGGCDWSKA